MDSISGLAYNKVLHSYSSFYTNDLYLLLTTCKRDICFLNNIHWQILNRNYVALDADTIVNSR